MMGSGALLFESTENFGEAAQKKVLHVSELANRWPGVREAVPGMNNLLVIFDLLVLSADEVKAKVETAWDGVASETSQGRLVEIPVSYGGESGPDLAELATHSGMDIATVVELHSQAIYTVYFLGAHPGFAYLGGLDPRIQMPRRKVPRQKVSHGTVAIGGVQAGVVAQTTPSGWNLIGHTDLSFFDALNTVPALLAPGDRVRFRCLGITDV